MRPGVGKQRGIFFGPVGRHWQPVPSRNSKTFAAKPQNAMQDAHMKWSTTQMLIEPGFGLGLMHEQHVCAVGLAAKAGTETLCMTGAAHSSVPPTIAPRLTSSRREMP